MLPDVNDSRGQVILDNARDGWAEVFSRPSRTFVARQPADVPDTLAAMQRALAEGHYLAGYFSYELGYVLEPHLGDRLPAERQVPLIWFGQYDEPPTILQGDAIEALWPRDRVYASPLTFEWDRNAYRNRFDAVMEAIRRGDAYQVNLSMRAHFRVTGDARALYGQLRHTSGGAHGAFIDDGERQLLGFSPELFFALDAEGTMTTRPMKGTVPRGADDVTDRAQREALRHSLKNRTENLMIVDLIRNDLGRLAVPGTVAVPELFTVETYPTVHQMTSTVQATLPSGSPIASMLAALFPCGSITGAPKIRAMQIIRDLEASARGAYCGAIGHFAPDGAARFSVAIRTLTVTDGVGELGVGGAVVSDSDADQEYDECLLKARFYEAGRRPITLLETLPYQAGKWPRLHGHLRRMRDGARALGLTFDLSAATTALRKATADAGATTRKVRLVLHDDGSMTAESTAMPPTPDVMRFVIASGCLRSDDPLRGYKTGWRETYDDALAEAKACGADEAILLNERGEVCEGSYTNLFIKDGHGLLTPPLHTGALPGRLRAALIAAGRCREAVLTLDDLERADTIYLGNSLRGLVKAAPLSVQHASKARTVASTRRVG
ncbi:MULTISPECIES: aminodeoxychorismate synthase component I [unclassified Luteibacter]|jgi:para-aminobenzoate synthetase/4-amino-4-deoxychorismate lyase|uniref:aminodeoxychorismate synthase component I n=1 Tax=Luteibacter sp. PvP019 TaxID=3156436 RepID=UPI00339499D5